MAKNGKANGDAAGVGHNSKNLTEQGKAFVERVEELNRNLASEKSSYMTECKTIREDITAVLTEAHDAGITRKTIKAAVKIRALQRKADEAREALDIAEIDHLDNIRLALGDLADTALGKAALGEGDSGLDQATA